MRVFILAGEPSGDRLGSALMEGLRSLVPDIEFQGVGGVEMQAQGLSSNFPMEELSIMGLVEVLPKYRHLKRRIAETAQAVLDMKPDVLITIDSPDFSLRVAKLVKQSSNIRTVHYVAPSVWAWRPKRAVKMAKVIDHVLALLPFEPPYMTAQGMECDFVGHPVAGEVEATSEDISAFRGKYDLGNAPYLLMLPGSRRGEVSRLLDVFLDTAERFVSEHPEHRIVLPVPAPVIPLVSDALKDRNLPITLLDPREKTGDEIAADKRAAFAGATVALAASGTVSLELAAAGTPMVIGYRLNWLTWQMAKVLVKLDTATLVNLVSGTRTVPEHLGPACTVDNLSASLSAILGDPSAQNDAMFVTMERLGRGGEAPGLRAARAVLDRLQR